MGWSAVLNSRSLGVSHHYVRLVRSSPIPLSVVSFDRRPCWSGNGLFYLHFGNAADLRGDNFAIYHFLYDGLRHSCLAGIWRSRDHKVGVKMVTEPRAGETLSFLTVLSLLKMLSATVYILTLIFKTFVCVCVLGGCTCMYVCACGSQRTTSLWFPRQWLPCFCCLFVLSQDLS